MNLPGQFSLGGGGQNHLKPFTGHGRSMNGSLLSESVVDEARTHY